MIKPLIILLIIRIPLMYLVWILLNPILLLNTIQLVLIVFLILMLLCFLLVILFKQLLMKIYLLFLFLLLLILFIILLSSVFIPLVLFKITESLIANLMILFYYPWTRYSLLKIRLISINKKLLILLILLVTKIPLIYKQWKKIHILPDRLD